MKVRVHLKGGAQVVGPVLQYDGVVDTSMSYNPNKSVLTLLYPEKNKEVNFNFDHVLYYSTEEEPTDE